MAKCEVCGKGPQFGHSVSHSMHHTNRRWKPNIQRIRITKGGVEKRLNVCAKCMKTMQKND